MEFTTRPEDDLLTVPRTQIKFPISPVLSRLDTPPRQGLCRATLAILRLVEEGLAFAGLPCSSFVYLNRATSFRSRNKPLGDESKSYVSGANTFPSCM